MDEGFTSFYASDIVENELARAGLLSWPGARGEPLRRHLRRLCRVGHQWQRGAVDYLNADDFSTNYAYSLAAYVKGSVFLSQLEYIIGKREST